MARKHADKYFTRSKEILEKDNLNPYVRAQVFVRKGPGVVSGLDEAVKYIKEETNLLKNGGKLYALKNGMNYKPLETQIILEGYIQDIIEHETEYLGILSKGISLANKIDEPNLDEITKKASIITRLVGNRPVSYFGARHWHPDDDAKIAKATYNGGFTNASTDAGAKAFGKKGIGTIPHALENVYAWKYGKEFGVQKATEAFDKYISKDVPRIALIDFNNKEIDDTIATAKALDEKLNGVRVDTCGENISQGSLKKYDQEKVNKFFEKKLNDIPQEYQKYWAGNGVTISGVYSLNKALLEEDFQNLNIILTSGFGSVEKIKAFLDAEKRLEMKLFDGLGVGGIYKSIAATMDIVAVGNDANSLEEMSKVGRIYRPNLRLEEVKQ